MAETHGIDIDRRMISDFCWRHHIRKLSLFGSILRDDFTPDSDVDMLMEFEPDHGPDLFSLVRMERGLSDALGRKVDLRTPEELSKYFRQKVLDAAEPLYVR